MSIHVKEIAETFVAGRHFILKQIFAATINSIKMQRKEGKDVVFRELINLTPDLKYVLLAW